MTHLPEPGCQPGLRKWCDKDLIAWRQPAARAESTHYPRLGRVEQVDTRLGRVSLSGPTNLKPVRAVSHERVKTGAPTREVSRGATQRFPDREH